MELRQFSRLSALSVLMFVTVCLEAQTIEDALRYSTLNPQGTARSTAIGGAMGALGADFSAVSINPAGIGAFWKSEISLTPSYNFSTVESSLNGGPGIDQTGSKFGFGSIGIVFTNQGRASSDWKAVSLGISMSKLARYNGNSFFRGETQGSITDRWVALSDGLTPDELTNFETGIAFEAGAIFDFDEDLFYDTDFQGFENVAFRKQQLVEESGAYNDLNISLGANLKNKLLMGIAVGVPFLNYTREEKYEEIDDLDAIPVFESLEFLENLETDGVGINLKVGAIYKLNDNLRVGASYHTPTFFSMTETFTSDVNYSLIQDGIAETFAGQSPLGEFEYTLTTPWRATGSLAYILGRKGFVSADVEYVDYAAAKFDFTSDSDNPDDAAYEREVNAEIDLVYSSSLNFRIGGELALDMFRARAGLQLLGSPFRDDNSLEPIYSIGAGYRGESVYLDLSFAMSRPTTQYSPYQISGAPMQLVDQSATRNQVALTFGIKI